MARALFFAAFVSACGFSHGHLADDESQDAEVCSQPSLSCATPTVLRECRASGEAPVDTGVHLGLHGGRTCSLRGPRPVERRTAGAGIIGGIEFIPKTGSACFGSARCRSPEP